MIKNHCSLTKGIRQKLLVSLKGGSMKLSGISGSVFKQKKSKHWWICIRYQGKRYRFSAKTDSKTKAEQILAEAMLRLYSGANIETRQKQAVDAGNAEMTFAEFFKKHYYPYCEGRNVRPKTKLYIFNSLPDWFKKLKIKHIGLKEVEKLQSEVIKKQLKPSSVNKITGLIKHCFTKLEDWEIIPEAQLRAIRKAKNLRTTSRLRYLTDEEIERLLQACDSHIYPIVLTALHTGMRRGEILGLKWKNIDLKNGLILLETTKNGERREIPMSETMKALFKRLFTTRNLSSEYVFTNPDTGKRYIDIKRSFNSACMKAGIVDFNFHDLRHTFASQLVMKGVDIKTVQELLGHKTLNMTLRYAHLSSVHRKEAVRTLDSLIKIHQTATR